MSNPSLPGAPPAGAPTPGTPPAVTPPAVTLYHCPDARSFRCLWLLEELGLPCVLRLMDFPPRLKAPGYQPINPAGTVPWLQDGEVALWESAAALEYLAQRHSPRTLAVAPDEPGHADWLNWLHFGEASMTTVLSTQLRYSVFEPPERRQPQVVADCRELFLSRLARVDAAVRQHEHLAGGRFTVADISVGYALMLGRSMGMKDSYPAAVQAYWARLSARPGFLAAKARQKTTPKDPQLAGDTA